MQVLQSKVMNNSFLLLASTNCQKKCYVVDGVQVRDLMATKCNESEPELRTILTWDNLAVCKRYFGIQARLYPFNHLRETLATCTHEMDTHHTIQPSCHVRTRISMMWLVLTPKRCMP